MKMIKLIQLGFLIILMQGCATMYQKMGYTGGYSDSQLDVNIFRVVFSGNGYTSYERAADFTLLRSAELALENGYRFFTIIDSKTSTEHSTYTTPTRSYTQGRVYGSGNYSATTTTRGGQTFLISKPSSSNTIVCFDYKPSDVFSYNAKIIYKSIRKKYRMPQKNKIFENIP